MRKIFEPEQMEFSTLEKVRERLKAMGMREPERPGFDIPDVPKDLIARGGDFVAELYRKLEAWYEYMLNTHTIAELQMKEWKNNLSVLTKKLVQDGLEERNIDVDEAVLAARMAQQTSEQEAAMWGVQVSSLDRRMRMVSRAITILEQEMEKSRRAANIGAGKPWPFERKRVG